MIGTDRTDHFSAEEFASIPALPLDMKIGDAIRFLSEEYALTGWRTRPKDRAHEAVSRIAPISFPSQTIGELDVVKPTTFAAELPARGRLALALLIRDVLLPAIDGRLPEPSERNAKPSARSRKEAV